MAQAKPAGGHANPAAVDEEQLPLREQNRRRRRKELIAAAREVFYESQFVTATVEDILQRAGVSRPTFYRYFSDKDAVLREIMLEDVSSQSALWQKLAELGADPTDAQLVQWVRRFIKGIRRDVSAVTLFNIAAGVDNTLVHDFSRARDHYIAILGGHIEAFRMRGDGSRLDAERRAAAHLLCYQVEQVAFNFAFPNCDLSEEACARAFARSFRQFMEIYG